MTNQLTFMRCMDCEAFDDAFRDALEIPPDDATKLGQSAEEIVLTGEYAGPEGERISIANDIAAACLRKQSIPPDAPLPARSPARFGQTKIQVINGTILRVSRMLLGRDLKPLAINFSNGCVPSYGIIPGGGCLYGSKTQEEVLCRSSALSGTLDGDPMHQHHFELPHKQSSDWAILSPDVPVFRDDDGSPEARPWPLSFLTCVAPYCGFPPEAVSELVASDDADLTYTALVQFEAKKAADRLRQRIHRVLAIAEAYGYETLVFGAWGSGAFNHDPAQAAADFRATLENEFAGSFSRIVFAIIDWTPERKFLGLFRDVFSSSSGKSP